MVNVDSINAILKYFIRSSKVGTSAVCMVTHYSKSMDRPGKAVNPARGQLNRENEYFPCPRSRLRSWSRETVSAVPSRVSLLISILRLNLMLTGFLSSSAAVSIYAFKTSIHHRVSPELMGSRNCVPMTFTSESPPAQGQ